MNTKFKSYNERLADAGIEVFYYKDYNDGDLKLEKGYYWWSCQPGCLPDSEPNGPYATYNDAARDALEGLDNV